MNGLDFDFKQMFANKTECGLIGHFCHILPKPTLKIEKALKEFDKEDPL